MQIPCKRAENLVVDGHARSFGFQKEVSGPRLQTQPWHYGFHLTALSPPSHLHQTHYVQWTGRSHRSCNTQNEIECKGKQRAKIAQRVYQTGQAQFRMSFHIEKAFEEFQIYPRALHNTPKKASKLQKHKLANFHFQSFRQRNGPWGLEKELSSIMTEQ